MKYPNGQQRNMTVSRTTNNYHNRGMTLEEDINLTNDYYRVQGRAIIHKKPTPVQIVKVNYPKRSAAVITEGYFRQASTTDYNGIYKQRYIDFEAKETKSETSLPLANFHEHQINHMKEVVQHGAICFILIRFATFNETFLLNAEKLFTYWDDQLKGGRKSIPYSAIQQAGYLIPFRYQARVDYLEIIDRLYFRSEETS